MKPPWSTVPAARSAALAPLAAGRAPGARAPAGSRYRADGLGRVVDLHERGFRWVYVCGVCLHLRHISQELYASAGRGDGISANCHFEAPRRGFLSINQFLTSTEPSLRATPLTVVAESTRTWVSCPTAALWRARPSLVTSKPLPDDDDLDGLALLHHPRLAQHVGPQRQAGRQGNSWRCGR
jgi:hypothetical protein